MLSFEDIDKFLKSVGLKLPFGAVILLGLVLLGIVFAVKWFFKRHSGPRPLIPIPILFRPYVKPVLVLLAVVSALAGVFWWGSCSRRTAAARALAFKDGEIGILVLRIENDEKGLIQAEITQNLRQVVKEAHLDALGVRCRSVPDCIDSTAEIEDIHSRCRDIAMRYRAYLVLAAVPHATERERISVYLTPLDAASQEPQRTKLLGPPPHPRSLDVAVTVPFRPQELPPILLQHPIAMACVGVGSLAASHWNNRSLALALFSKAEQLTQPGTHEHMFASFLYGITIVNGLNAAEPLDVDDAIARFRHCADQRYAPIDRVLWIWSQHNLGNLLGMYKSDFQGALSLYENALRFVPKDRMPDEYLGLQFGIAASLNEPSDPGYNAETARRVLRATSEALSVIDPKRHPDQYQALLVQDGIGAAWLAFKHENPLSAEAFEAWARANSSLTRFLDIAHAGPLTNLIPLAVINTNFATLLLQHERNPANAEPPH